MANLLRKSLAGAVTAIGLTAMVAASATPAAADWRGHRGGWGNRGGGAVAAGIIGGLALGALAAGASRSYAAPAYAAPVYGAPVYVPTGPAYVEADPEDYPVCHKEYRPLYTADGRYLRDRKVNICE